MVSKGVVHGDDSLNEESEEDRTDELEQKISEEFGGPTREQLIATGEVEPEGEVEEVIAEQAEEEAADAVEEEQPQPAPGTAVTKVEDKELSELSVSKQIEARLLAGATREELLAGGYNKNSIRTVASTIKNKLPKQLQRGAVAQTKTGTQIFAKGSPPEAIIDGIRLPDVSDGHGPSFEQGMKFGMSVIVLATRIVQDISTIGMQQTKPLIEAAREMRAGEEAAAKNAAGEAAMEASGLVMDKMMPVLASLSKNASGGGSDADPMRAMMAEQFRPIIAQVMSGMLSNLLPGGNKLELPTGKTGTGWEHTKE